jgi:queuine/archaeosine tRNA-ribosyltransferase
MSTISIYVVVLMGFTHPVMGDVGSFRVATFTSMKACEKARIIFIEQVSRRDISYVCIPGIRE